MSDVLSCVCVCVSLRECFNQAAILLCLKSPQSNFLCSVIFISSTQAKTHKHIYLFTRKEKETVVLERGGKSAKEWQSEGESEIGD